MFRSEGGSDAQQRTTGAVCFSLSLSLCVINFLAPSAEAAKVTLEKHEIFSTEGELLGFRGFTAHELDSLGVAVIADYPTYVAGEVVDDHVAAFQQAATNQGILFALHPEWDVIALNGYAFPSDGPPLGLPPDLQIPGFDGDTGLYLVQLKAPPAAGWREVLARVGDVIGYYPWNTYLMRFPPDALPTVRALSFVQHCSPYQPAYKISANIPDAEQPVDVVVVLDGGQDLTQVTALLDSYGAAGLATLPGESRGVVQVALDGSRLRTIARRVEVLWVEPQYEIEFSDERQATIVAGQYDAEVPPLRPIRYSGGVGGHEAWLRAKGFCTPTYPDPGCMYYWTKVGVFDSGLDRTVCEQGDYDDEKGICTPWDFDRHVDLDHDSNLPGNCPPPGEGMETNGDCDEPVVYRRMYCYHVGTGPNACLDSASQAYDFSDEADSGDHAGHGTSVASIIGGDPHADPQPDPGDYYKGSGIAPSSQVVVAKIAPYDTDPEPPIPAMTPADWASLVERVNDVGESDPIYEGTVRIANNSWNLKPQDGSDYDEYTLFSRQADILARDADPGANGLQEMTLVFSVGNCLTPYIPCPAASPGNAKNVISVGASRGYSEWIGVPPPGDSYWSIADDECGEWEHFISDIPGFQEDYHFPWSRRGFPSEPARFKPDLVAPGSQVAAARSSYFELDPGGIHRCFYGTSASAPAVTAAAVLVEAWYWHTFGYPLPSPAMIKAMLIAHADDLAGAHDHCPVHCPSEDPLPHSPSIAQGWGRVNLDALIPDNSPPPSPAVAVFDQDHGSAGRRFTAKKQYWSVQLHVENPAEDVIAVMVFTDAPSELPASILVMNDLDLKITQSSLGGIAHTFWGNHFASGSWYSEDTAGQILPSPPKDRNNTVEVIRVPAGVLSGSFSIRVTAASIVAKAVPGLDGGAYNQDFALYVDNATQ